jgi:hypothetical protein
MNGRMNPWWCIWGEVKQYQPMLQGLAQPTLFVLSQMATLLTAHYLDTAMALSRYGIRDRLMLA